MPFMANLCEPVDCLFVAFWSEAVKWATWVARSSACGSRSALPLLSNSKTHHGRIQCKAS